MSTMDDEDEDILQTYPIKKYFTPHQYEQLSQGERCQFAKMRWEYEMLAGLGMNVEMPTFMKKKSRFDLNREVTRRRTRQSTVNKDKQEVEGTKASNPESSSNYDETNARIECQKEADSTLSTVDEEHGSKDTGTGSGNEHAMKCLDTSLQTGSLGMLTEQGLGSSTFKIVGFLFDQKSLTVSGEDMSANLRRETEQIELENQIFNEEETEAVNSHLYTAEITAADKSLETKKADVDDIQINKALRQNESLIGSVDHSFGNDDDDDDDVGERNISLNDQSVVVEEIIQESDIELEEEGLEEEEHVLKRKDDLIDEDKNRKNKDEVALEEVETLEQEEGEHVINDEKECDTKEEGVGEQDVLGKNKMMEREEDDLRDEEEKETSEEEEDVLEKNKMMEREEDDLRDDEEKETSEEEEEDVLKDGEEEFLMEEENKGVRVVDRVENDEEERAIEEEDVDEKGVMEKDEEDAMEEYDVQEAECQEEEKNNKMDRKVVHNEEVNRCNDLDATYGDFDNGCSDISSSDDNGESDISADMFSDSGNQIDHSVDDDEDVDDRDYDDSKSTGSKDMEGHFIKKKIVSVDLDKDDDGDDSSCAGNENCINVPPRKDEAIRVRIEENIDNKYNVEEEREEANENGKVDDKDDYLNDVSSNKDFNNAVNKFSDVLDNVAHDEDSFDNVFKEFIGDNDEDQSSGGSGEDDNNYVISNQLNSDRIGQKSNVRGRSDDGSDSFDDDVDNSGGAEKSSDEDDDAFDNSSNNGDIENSEVHNYGIAAENECGNSYRTEMEIDEGSEENIAQEDENEDDGNEEGKIEEEENNEADEEEAANSPAGNDEVIVVVVEEENKSEGGRDQVQTMLGQFAVTGRREKKPLTGILAEKARRETKKRLSKARRAKLIKSIKNFEEAIPPEPLKPKPEYRCGVCGFVYTRSSHLRRHQISQLGPNGLKCISQPEKKTKFECDTCGQVFNRSYNLNRHIKVKHLKKEEVEGSAEVSPLSLPENILIQSSDPITLKSCDEIGPCSSKVDSPHEGKMNAAEREEEKILNSSQLLLNVDDKNTPTTVPLPHYSKYDKDTKEFKCEKCEKVFSRSYNLKRHLLTHTDEKPFQCVICGKGFRQASHLVDHERSHTGDKSFKCSICNQLFSRRSHLAAHQKTHSAEKSFKCDICDKAFARSDYLLNHKRVHERDKLKEVSKEKPPKEKKKKKVIAVPKTENREKKVWECQVCQKQFSIAMALVGHERIHNKTKVLCDICGETFTHKTYLLSHKRVHKEKFWCKRCCKHLSKETFLKHVKRHSMERSQRKEGKEKKEEDEEEGEVCRPGKRKKIEID